MPPPVSEPLQSRARELALARCATIVSGMVVLVGAVTIAVFSVGRVDFTHQNSAAGIVDKIVPSLSPTVRATYPSDEEIRRNWPRFRGPGGLGTCAYTNIPTAWDGAAVRGILWKTPVPLPGHNSPVVWGNRIFLSGATEQRRQVFCFDAETGQLLWQRDVPTATTESPMVMEDTGYAAPTMAIDGRHACAIFATGDVACFDFDGRMLWSKNLGTPDSVYGYASSLEIYQNLLVIQFDQGTEADNASKLLALKIDSGALAWQSTRTVAASWTSPILIHTESGPQIVTCSTPLVIATDPMGQQIWRVNCMGSDVAPSPVYAAGLIFVTQPYERLCAIKPVGRGDITKTNIVWTAEDGIPDICSPVANDQMVFLLSTSGTLTCYEAANGKKLWEHDLNANFRSSPSLVGDRLYLLSEEGRTFIVAAAREFREIGRANLAEPSTCSPAFMDGRIYIRGSKNLYCIGAR